MRAPDRADQVASLALLTACCGITFPLLIFFGYQLKSQWNERYLIKRKRSIILCLYLLILVTTIFVILYAIARSQQIHEVAFLQPEMLTFFASGVLNTLHLLVALVLGIRVWLLYCDYQYCELLMSRQYQIVIDPESYQNNWFLKHHATFCSSKFFLKWIIFPAVILRIIIYILIFSFQRLNSDNVRSIDGSSSLFLLIIVAAVLGTLWSRYPDYNDAYFIRYELRAFFVYLFIMLLLVITPVAVAVLWFQLSYSWLHVTLQPLWWGQSYITIIQPKLLVQRETKGVRRRARSLKKQDTFTVTRIMETKREYDMFSCFLAQQFSLEVRSMLLFVDTGHMIVSALYIEPFVCHRGLSMFGIW